MNIQPNPTPEEVAAAVATLAAFEAARNAPAAAVVPVPGAPSVVASRLAIEVKYQAEVVGPMSRNYDGARFAARAKIERDHALAALDGADPAANDAARTEALRLEAQGVSLIGIKYNLEPFSEAAYQAARPRHLPSA